MLKPALGSTLSALEAKKLNFEFDNLVDATESNLRSLRAATDELADALIIAVPAGDARLLAATKSQIDSSFENAIAAFA